MVKPYTSFASVRAKAREVSKEPTVVVANGGYLAVKGPYVYGEDGVCLRKDAITAGVMRKSWVPTSIG